jgi:hypothetical protein
VLLNIAGVGFDESSPWAPEDVQKKRENMQKLTCCYPQKKVENLRLELFLPFTFSNFLETAYYHRYMSSGWFSRGVCAGRPACKTLLIQICMDTEKQN